MKFMTVVIVFATVLGHSFNKETEIFSFVTIAKLLRNKKKMLSHAISETSFANGETGARNLSIRDQVL